MTDVEYASDFMRRLSQYVPIDAVARLYDFLKTYSVHMKITRKRNSKLGDYRWPQPGVRNHQITINGDLNQYLFLWVLLHEMAHLNCHVKYQQRVMPHGHEWQREYSHLIKQYIDCFPPELSTSILRFASRIPHSTKLRIEIERQMDKYTLGRNDADLLTLDQLPPGTQFHLANEPSIHFKSQHKRRTFWLCSRLPDGRPMLVRGTALVVVD